MRTFLIFSLVLVAFFAYSEACSCRPTHPQTHFCNSDFVILATVLSRRTVDMGENIVYTVRILKDFKNGGGRRYSRKQEIYTRASSAQCGSYFQLNKEYLISGSIDRRRWETASCNWNHMPSYLSEYQATALNRGIYKKSCSCEIEQCDFIGKKCPPERRGNCVIRSDSEATCRYQSNSCILTTYGCCWDSRSCSNHENNGYQNL